AHARPGGPRSQGAAAERDRSVQGAQGPGRRIAGASVLLMDDVLTTGATLLAYARALKRAGARQVDVLVLARVVREIDITI
ncbi:MAG TPA: phosphoribosyltransferase family protein, partial [Hyphomonas sp.]|nr:phosphoribosyltransferase family protein [Hyphomonas sp.]